MYIFDQQFTIESQQELSDYFYSYPYQTSGLAFSAMYMWRESNRFCWQKIGDYLCIAGVSFLELEGGDVLPFMMPPLTRTGTYDPDSLKRTIEEAREIFEKQGYAFDLRLVPEHMVDLLQDACGGKLTVTEDPPNHDYIYRVEDLVNLSGRKYHSKKNHLNYFKKNYEYEYVPLTSKMTDEAMVFLTDWNRSKEIPPSERKLLQLEEDALEDVLRNLDTVGYYAGAIRIEGKMEALVIGGRVNDSMVAEHVEKANVNIRGLYQAINNEFCKQVSPWAQFINREEDMGIEGLRTAKLSYRPCEILKKYILTFG